MVIITLGAAFGVLSGRGATIGMMSTCIISIVSALFSGSRYGISSPTGPMTAAISSILVLEQSFLAENDFGIHSIQLMNLVLIFSGVFLILLTLLRVHSLVKWVPKLVISGFINGIALLIVFAQFRSVEQIQDILLMMTTFLVAFFVGKLQKDDAHIIWKIFSSSFVVIAFMSFIIAMLNIPVHYSEFTNINSSIVFSLPSFEVLNGSLFLMIVIFAFELALISLLDTLLTAVIIDKKSKTKTKIRRELAGQGISLGIMSLFGGIPGAKSTVPSLMMWQEQGHHKYSKILLAIFCLLFAFLFFDVIQYIPTAVFGGIILKIALDVADITAIQSVFRDFSRKNILQIGVLLGTMLATVFVSLNVAVLFFTTFFVLWNTCVKKSLQIADLDEKEAEGVKDEI